MNKTQRILGLFAVVALGVSGCNKSENNPTVVQETPEKTTMSIYTEGHLVRERMSSNYMVGADFKQNIYFKSIIIAPGANSSVSSTIQIPFADIKDQETLDQIARMRVYYEQTMMAKKPEVGPAPVPAPAPK
jgi:hypothetical protein